MTTEVWWFDSHQVQDRFSSPTWPSHSLLWSVKWLVNVSTDLQLMQTLNMRVVATPQLQSSIRLHDVYREFLTNTTCQSITQHFNLYTIKIVYCQGDMFRPLLGHLQAFWEIRSKSYLYLNALWDPKCLQIVLYDCKIHTFLYVVMCVTVSALKG